MQVNGDITHRKQQKIGKDSQGSDHGHGTALQLAEERGACRAVVFLGAMYALLVGHATKKKNKKRCSYISDVQSLQSTTWLCWRRSTVVERWSLTAELSLSCARLLAGRMITLWVRRPL